MVKHGEWNAATWHGLSDDDIRDGEDDIRDGEDDIDDVDGDDERGAGQQHQAGDQGYGRGRSLPKVGCYVLIFLICMKCKM